MNSLTSRVRIGTRNKLGNKQKNKVFPRQWISGTSIANYLLKDPVIDWLKTYYQTHGLNNTRITRSKLKKSMATSGTSRGNVLMRNGCYFENNIYTDLVSKFGSDNVVNLRSQHTATPDQKTAAFNRTLAEIEKCTPIILQAYIKSDTLKLEGVTDILIRSDHLHKLVREDVEVESSRPHYVVVDVKWSHMPLCVDGKTIRNDGRFKAYKGQLLIYNIIIGELQSYTPRAAYVMAKSWNIDKKGEERNGKSCYDLLGVIDYSGRDASYIDETIKAINWVRTVQEDGAGWSPLTPHIKEMCCNSCNQDETWAEVKKTIMAETRDITQLWMVTPDQRNIAFDKGIKRWDDARCRSSVFMGSGTKSRTVDAILDINKNSSISINLNNVDNRCNWHNYNQHTTRDYYIDYETISEAFIENPNMDINNGKLMDGYIFMIGVGCETENGFRHTSFVCNEYTPTEERRIICEFFEFVMSNAEGRHIRLFHWGSVEKTLMDAALIRHSIDNRNIPWLGYSSIDWIDMCSVFTAGPVVVKGALSFKLKEIAGAMFSNGLIKTRWSDGELSNGLAAMHQAISYYSKKEGNMAEIKKYNMIDCKVVWEIVRCLRILV